MPGPWPLGTLKVLIASAASGEHGLVPPPHGGPVSPVSHNLLSKQVQEALDYVPKPDIFFSRLACLFQKSIIDFDHLRLEALLWHFLPMFASDLRSFKPKSWRGEPVPIEQWMAGTFCALAFALMLARCFWISLLLAIAALILELLALASHGLQRYLGMGPARVAVAIAPGSIRFCIISVNLQSHSMISKLAVLPLPLLLTGFSASELSLELQLRSFRLQFRASGLALAVRCREAAEWDKVAAAMGAQSAALAQLENLFNIMERRYREEVALTFAAKSDRFGSVKQMVDSIINCVEVKASDFSLKLETMRHTGEDGEDPESAEKFLAHIQVGLFHLPAAVPEPDPQMPCREVSACEEGESFCPRMQRDISINGFNLNILGAASAGLRAEEDEAQGSLAGTCRNCQLQDDLFGSMPNMCIRLAMPPVLGHLLSGQRRPWRRISADLTGRGTAAGTLNVSWPNGMANEALMKVVWALLGRYLAAGGWAYQLQLAELRAVQGAQNAADGTVLHPQPLTEERRSELLGQLRLKPWSKLKGQLSSWAAGCAWAERPWESIKCEGMREQTKDLLALRLEAAGCHFQEADGKALWRMALATMDKYSKDEKLFHELHVIPGSMVWMGAAWIHADLGRLFAKLGPKGTQAGLEVVDGVSVDGHARNWHAGGHPLPEIGEGNLEPWQMLSCSSVASIPDIPVAPLQQLRSILRVVNPAVMSGEADSRPPVPRAIPIPRFAMEQMHRVGRCTPCRFFAFRDDGCHKGNACEFCHLCSGPDALKRSKRAHVARKKQEDAMQRKLRQFAVGCGRTGTPSLRARSVLVRGGTKLPAAPNVRPTVHLSVFLPAEPTGMQVKLLLNQARARLLPSPLLGTVLPADPRPPAPELPDQFIEDWETEGSHGEPCDVEPLNHAEAQLKHSHVSYVSHVTVLKFEFCTSSPMSSCEQALEASHQEHVEAPSHQEAPLPDTILGGMALFVEMDVRNCCAVLPLKPQLPSKLPDIAPDTDLDYDGLVVSAKVIHANLASKLTSAGGRLKPCFDESLGLSLEDATVVAPGGYAIMEPMAKVELRYLASWHEPPEGPKAPLRSLTIRLPMASLSVSLAVMRTVKHIATTLAKGFASDEQATAQPTALQEEDQFRRVRRLFLDNDVDNSGELERTEVFKLAERL
eukprot:s3913_g2.t2